MKTSLMMITALVLTGCVTTGTPTDRQLALYYSPEQTTLTAQQKSNVAALFDAAPRWALDVAPSSDARPFQALHISQQRIKAIRQLAAQSGVRLSEQYQPQQTADTVIIREP